MIIRYFPKVDFPRDNVTSGNFPKVRLSPLRSHRLQWGGGANMIMVQTLWLGQSWEVAFAKVTNRLTTFPTQDMFNS